MSGSRRRRRHDSDADEDDGDGEGFDSRSRPMAGDSISCSNRDLDDLADSVTITRVPFTTHAWIHAPSQPPPIQNLRVDDSGEDGEGEEDDGIDLFDDEMDDEERSRLIQQRRERQLERERLQETEEQRQRKEKEHQDVTKALALLATGEEMTQNNGITSSDTFCYLCYSAGLVDNPYRTAILTAVSYAAKMDERCAFEMIRRFYEFHLRDAIGHAWNTTTIRDHFYIHDPNSALILTNNIRCLVQYCQAFEQTASRVDDSNRPLPPDSTHVADHLKVMKMLEASMTRRDKQLR